MVRGVRRSFWFRFSSSVIIRFLDGLGLPTPLLLNSGLRSAFESAHDSSEVAGVVQKASLVPSKSKVVILMCRFANLRGLRTVILLRLSPLLLLLDLLEMNLINFALSL